MAGLAMVASLASEDFYASPPKGSTEGGEPIRQVDPPLPKGAKVWAEYGNVVAINEKNAKRKYQKLKTK